jgi:hypothetical protein
LFEALPCPTVGVAMKQKPRMASHHINHIAIFERRNYTQRL